MHTLITSTNSFNAQAKRIRLYTWTYVIILVITICGSILSRSLQNETVSNVNNTESKFQHPWFQTLFYCFAKCLCVLIIFHPDYNSTFGLSPPNILFPVSASAFVSCENKDVPNQTQQTTDCLISDNDIDTEQVILSKEEKQGMEAISSSPLGIRYMYII